MTDNNGHNGDNQVKQCPFLNKECIGEKCAIYSVLMSDMVGIQKKFGTCSFNAVVMILSEINQKATIEQQKFQLPKGLLRG